MVLSVSSRNLIPARPKKKISFLSDLGKWRRIRGSSIKRARVSSRLPPQYLFMEELVASLARRAEPLYICINTQVYMGGWRGGGGSFKKVTFSWLMSLVAHISQLFSYLFSSAS